MSTAYWLLSDMPANLSSWMKQWTVFIVAFISQFQSAVQRMDEPRPRQCAAPTWAMHDSHPWRQSSSIKEMALQME